MGVELGFDSMIFVLEIIGVIAFAVSGVMVAKERKMDIFGAVVLGCSTAAGGGMVRDLLLGEIPPLMFRRPIYVTVAFLLSLLTFFIEYHRSTVPAKTLSMLNAADSIGLAVFVVVGCRAAWNAGYADNLFLTAFVGVLTGVGGGILRDILAGQMPLIMRKRVYGLAAALGAVVFCGLEKTGVELVPCTAASIAVTVMIRFLAMRYHWNLPSFAEIDKKNNT